MNPSPNPIQRTPDPHIKPNLHPNPKRLHFIGRMEHLADDFAALASMLEQGRLVRHEAQEKVALASSSMGWLRDLHKLVNFRGARAAKALRPEGRENRALARMPLVRRHLSADRCLLREYTDNGVRTKGSDDF